MTDGPANGPGAYEFTATAAALRYTLAVLDGPHEDAADELTWDEICYLGPALAQLVVGARRALAEERGIAGPEAQAAWARAQLQGELEVHELNAVFAVVEAEERRGGG